jgi:TetR/AcrR family transcriptional repressor of mexJK operon
MAIADKKTSEFSPAKRALILEGARRAFAELGYERASMDLIAARAGVSKATVYNHFEDKRALFFAACLDLTADLRGRIAEVFESQRGDAAVDLQRVGEHFLEVLLAPGTVALHRVLMSEVARFPELGQALYEQGASTMIRWVATYLERQHASGRLLVEDPVLASKQFLALCQVDLVTQCQLGLLTRTSTPRIRASVAQAVQTFLRAYRR